MKKIVTIFTMLVIASMLVIPAQAKYHQQESGDIELISAVSAGTSLTATINSEATTAEMIVVNATAAGTCTIFTGNNYLCDSMAYDVTFKNTSQVEQEVYVCFTVTTIGAQSWARLSGPTGNGMTLPTWTPTSFYKCEQDVNINADTQRAFLMRSDSWGGATPFQYPYGTSIQFISQLVISFSPINTCEEFLPLTSDSFEIDPTLELPLGPEGDPADDQIYATQTGEVYEISVDGGPWNDGTIDRDTDTAVSWDGETWTPLGDMIPTCFNPVGSVFVTAESDTLYFRADDTAGNFADNTNNPDPVIFTITLSGVPFASCDSQFTYDVGEDLEASIVVQGNDEDGVLASGDLVTGEWYVVEVVSGTWQDEGAPPDRVDMEYYNGGVEFTLGIGGIPYADLSGGSNVLCQNTGGTISYIQAKDDNLYLRVNNETGEFTNNTGALNVNVYHAAFTRTPDTCETSYQLGNLIDTGNVDATQEGGEVFAFMVGTESLGYLDYGLTPGAWYVLDTTGGPWQWKGATHSANGIDYDLAVSEDGSTWGALAEWDVPSCNIELDALGHRRIVFQMPESGAVEWKFRVNDSSVWFNNSGSISWNLYGATKLQVPVTPEGNCDYSYNMDAPLAVGEVFGNNATGVSLNGLTAGNIYALKVVGEGYGWAETFFGTNRYDTELSQTGSGGQFYDLPNGYTGVLCSETSGNDLLVFLQPGQNYQYQLRVNSTSFNDNSGKMGYVVYSATAGQSVSNTCFDGWYANAEWLNGFDWIDVRSQDGELIAADTARWEEFSGLIAGRTYMIETPVGQGPWWSAESSATKHWDIAVTNDNGTTWEPVSLASTMIDCASYNSVGHVWKARISVSEGEIWKIRVNDTNGAFDNNQGNMAYKLQTLCDHPACTPSIPNDSTVNGIPAISIQGGGDVCTVPVVRPGALGAAELLDIGNYFGSWTQYLNLSVLRYMAWCPVHTEAFLNFINKFGEKEPLATVKEWLDNLREIKRQIEGYNWGQNSFQDTSIFSIRSASDLDTKIMSHILPTSSTSRNPWNGSNIVSLSTSGGALPDSYYSCDSSFVDFLPSRLRSGVCFVSAYFIETSASFWIQIVLDISALFLLLAMLKGALQETIYMMTGVRPWTKSGANASIDKLASYLEKRDHDVDLDAELLSKRFGGSYGRNSDGSYRRK